MKQETKFFNLYSHGFIRAAVGIPEVRVADPAFHGARTIELMEKAEREKAIMALFPELGLSAYSCEDLFHQQALLDGSLDALRNVLKASEALNLITVVGMPLRVDQLLFNCAVVLFRGKVLGIVPKTFLPNYREFYEYRHFAPASAARSSAVDLLGQEQIPFGQHLLFQSVAQPEFTFFVEICEDLWVPISPSSSAALAGATVILNLSASNITIAKDEYRHSLVANQSARCLAAYLYTAAGTGESTTDLAWDGHAIVYENGALLAESVRFQYTSQLVLADLDLQRLSQERMRQTSFNQSVQLYRDVIRQFRDVCFTLELPQTGRLLCQRQYDRFPFVPSNPAVRDRQHPYARGERVYDVTFENVQAGERTSHLFRLANYHNALVLGTGDLSELALGWSTYGVGDHMSHYNVNASIPKTLIQFLIRWVADTRLLGASASHVLQDILATEVSPELVPGDGTGDEPSQKTEAVIGPYELHDFYVYYTTRLGYAPPKV